MSFSTGILSFLLKFCRRQNEAETTLKVPWLSTKEGTTLQVTDKCSLFFPVLDFISWCYVVNAEMSLAFMDAIFVLQLVL